MDASENPVERYYDAGAQGEWERQDRNRTEFAVTWRALDDYLPKPPAAVLDVGGGPGRYSVGLARRGYAVTLFDLARNNLDFAQAKAAEAGAALAGCVQGNALDMSRFADASFDAVLLMGPLYHLLELDQRRTAVREACRVLKPGGVILHRSSPAMRRCATWLGARRTSCSFDGTITTRFSKRGSTNSAKQALASPTPTSHTRPRSSR